MSLPAPVTVNICVEASYEAVPAGPTAPISECDHSLGSAPGGGGGGDPPAMTDTWSKLAVIQTPCCADATDVPMNVAAFSASVVDPSSVQVVPSEETYA